MKLMLFRHEDRYLHSVLWMMIVLAASPGTARAEDSNPRVLEIGPVWSGHPVGFAFATTKGHQYVAFYDSERQMTVAARGLDSDRWHLVRLPSQVGWDSHNYIALAIDDEGILHLSGNMHVAPLVYFRTSRPGDITSFEQVPQMVGHEEKRCTYPHFFRGPNNAFLFTYRDGSSGNGNQIYNVYDMNTKTWRRLLDRPLTDGEGQRNAYLQGPALGPDGFYHLIWVWRETPDCATNHDLSYARSRDLVHWETSSGRPLTLPITLETGEVVDAVPQHGGLINGCEHLGWDSQNRPIITYHKFDNDGKTQAYAARLENSKWVIRPLTNWDYRWDFQGGGSIVAEIHLGAIHPAGAERLQFDFSHPKAGSHRLVLDEASLETIETLPPAAPPWPRELSRPESKFPGMQVHLMSQRVGEKLHVLRWETLGANRDRPRAGAVPEPSPLRLYEFDSK